jgi:hypothetical protein
LEARFSALSNPIPQKESYGRLRTPQKPSICFVLLNHMYVFNFGVRNHAKQDSCSTTYATKTPAATVASPAFGCASETSQFTRRKTWDTATTRSKAESTAFNQRAAAKACSATTACANTYSAKKTATRTPANSNCEHVGA